MRFLRKLSFLLPGQTVRVQLQPIEEEPGKSPFDQAREQLGLPAWWKDEWFLPGGPVPTQKEIDDHRK